MNQTTKYVSIANPKPGIKETRVYTYPNAIVRVHIPDLDPEENERRREEFKKAAENFLRSILIEEQKTGRKIL